MASCVNTYERSTLYGLPHQVARTGGRAGAMPPKRTLPWSAVGRFVITVRSGVMSWSRADRIIWTSRIFSTASLCLDGSIVQSEPRLSAGLSPGALTRRKERARP